MESCLTSGNRIICSFQVDPRSVVSNGSKSCPTLRFRALPLKAGKIEVMSSTAIEKRHYSVIAYDLGLYLGGSKIQGASFLTSVICSGFPLHSWWDNYGTLEFIAPLDFFKLEAIERDRKGEVVLVICGTVTLAIHQDSIVSTNSELEPIDGYSHADLELYFRIAQSDWVEKVLSPLGHRKFHLLELDLSDCEIKKALEYISLAESAISAGQLVDGAIKCREMADYLTNQYLSFDKNGTQGEKWKRAISYFKHFASLSGHQEEKKAKVGAGFVFDRDDAEFTLILAKALIRYAQCLKKAD